MVNKQKAGLLPWLAIVVVIVLLLGSYVGAYFVASEYAPVPFVGKCRHFHNESIANMFLPIVKVESWVRNAEIEVVIGPPSTEN